MTNEKLIASAKDAIANYDIAKAHRVSVAPDRLAVILAEMVAVFEKAHTPTDDEREALADLVLNATAPYKVTDAWGAADAILAAGFRRSEIPEPSADHMDALSRIDQATAYVRASWLGTGEPTPNTPAGAIIAILRGVRTFTPEPQGEPSDDGHLIADCEHGVNSLYDRCAPCETAEQREPSHAHREAVQLADDIAEGGDPVPEDYERHYCDWDGEDWPCAAVRSAETSDDPGGRAFRSRTYRLLSERDFTGHMDEGRRTAFYEGWSAREQWESTRPAQGEPSDAQVHAAVNAWHRTEGTERADWYDNPINRERMRAALRAAGGVR